MTDPSSPRPPRGPWLKVGIAAAALAVGGIVIAAIALGDETRKRPALAPAAPAPTEGTGTATPPVTTPAPIDAAPERPPAIVVGSTLPACHAYVSTVNRALACAQLPADAKAGLRAGLEAMSARWSGDLTAAARAATEADCRTAAAALERTAGALGCTRSP